MTGTTYGVRGNVQEILAKKLVEYLDIFQSSRKFDDKSNKSRLQQFKTFVKEASENSESLCTQRAHTSDMGDDHSAAGPAPKNAVEANSINSINVVAASTSMVRFLALPPFLKLSSSLRSSPPVCLGKIHMHAGLELRQMRATLPSVLDCAGQCEHSICFDPG